MPHDCKTSGGHFFVHSPQIRSFICHRCRTSYNNYNPPVPRTSSAKQWYAGLRDEDRPKAPWRCIVEPCVFTVCLPCADYVQKVLWEMHEAKEAAEREGVEFVMAVELGKFEEDGKVGVDVQTAGQRAERKGEEEKERQRIANIMAATAAEENRIASEPMEVDADDTEGAEYSLDFLKRTTRSAAAAAAAAAANASLRVRARRPTLARRDPTRRSPAPVYD